MSFKHFPSEKDTRQDNAAQALEKAVSTLGTNGDELPLKIRTPKILRSLLTQGLEDEVFKTAIALHNKGTNPGARTSQPTRYISYYNGPVFIEDENDRALRTFDRTMIRKRGSGTFETATPKPFRPNLTPGRVGVDIAANQGQKD